MTIMKYLILLIIMIPSLSICQINENKASVGFIECNYLDSLLQKQIQKKITNLDALERSNNHLTNFKASGLNKSLKYIQNLANLKSRLTGVNIIEVYDWHSLYHYQYILCKLDSEKYYLIKKDLSKNKYDELGEIKQNYFSKLLSLSPSNPNTGDGSAYTAEVIFRPGHKAKLNLFPLVNIFEHNQLFLIEKIILNEKE